MFEHAKISHMNVKNFIMVLSSASALLIFDNYTLNTLIITHLSSKYAF